MKTFIPYKKEVFSKSPFYKDGIFIIHPYLKYMCKACGYALSTHFGGALEFTTQEDYNGICPLPENDKNPPHHYYNGVTHVVEPVFYPEELNTKVKIL